METKVHLNLMITAILVCRNHFLALLAITYSSKHTNHRVKGPYNSAIYFDFKVLIISKTSQEFWQPALAH